MFCSWKSDECLSGRDIASITNRSTGEFVFVSVSIAVLFFLFFIVFLIVMIVPQMLFHYHFFIVVSKKSDLVEDVRVFSYHMLKGLMLLFVRNLRVRRPSLKPTKPKRASIVGADTTVIGPIKMIATKISKFQLIDRLDCPSFSLSWYVFEKYDSILHLKFLTFSMHLYSKLTGFFGSSLCRLYCVWLYLVILMHFILFLWVCCVLKFYLRREDYGILLEETDDFSKKRDTFIVIR